MVECDFPRGFFELEVEILTRDPHVYYKCAPNWAFDPHVYYKCAQNWAFWIYLFFREESLYM